MSGNGVRIRNTEVVLTAKSARVSTKGKRKSTHVLGVPKKRFIRFAIVFANIALLVGVVAYVRTNKHTANVSRQGNATSESTPVNPLDLPSSADIAAQTASLLSMYESTSVSNNADTAIAKMAITSADDNVIARPQVVTTTAPSNKDIQSYTAKSGDTVAKIAEKFNVTSDSIRWSNNISGDTVTVGQKLWISPVSDGVVYVVKQGDTPSSIAEKFNASKQQIIAVNDAEIVGLIKGTRIIIPGGTVRSVSSPVSGSVSGGFAWGGYSPIYGNNGYEYGYCTYWAAVRRAQIGRPVPSNLGNAISWYSLAAASGLGVGAEPRKGAVVWTPATYGYGHVGFVEKVNPDGSVYISDMNQGWQWNVVTYQTLSKSEATAFKYIY